GKDTLDETRKKLDKRVSVEETKEEIVTVTVEDEDPHTAAEMANALIEELDKINKGAVMTSGQRMRAFVEKRLIESKEDLSRIERDLKSFQERNKAVKLDDQSKAIIEAIGSVKGQLMAKEVELDILLSYAAPTNPQVQLLKAEVEGLQNKLDELEGGKKGNPGGSSNIFIPTDRIPDLSFQYVRLFRDAKVQETLFELLTQQYEMARIQEAKDSPTVQVLDYATPPDKKSRPKRALIAAFSTISGFFFSLFMAFFVEYLNRIRTEA
ncbi:MAG: GNVR domain-containing protein, partial [Deltaproteobacteria bacterium]|nr:GNVR domain-containing protein [Deltaproteobacteria bacterium]